MERQKEQEIIDFLKKIGLNYSIYAQNKEGKEVITSSFTVITFTEGNFKSNLKDSLRDLTILCDDYIKKIDE
jgi:hypothetical protein